MYLVENFKEMKLLRRTGHFTGFRKLFSRGSRKLDTFKTFLSAKICFNLPATLLFTDILPQFLFFLYTFLVPTYIYRNSDVQIDQLLVDKGGV